MRACRRAAMLGRMPRFLLEHQHTARECGVVFAAFKGFESPLRHRLTVGGCVFGTHRIWWEATAVTAAAALDQLPPFVAARTTATEVGAVRTP
jgi:hypothetical protein